MYDPRNIKLTELKADLDFVRRVVLETCNPRARQGKYERFDCPKGKHSRNFLLLDTSNARLHCYACNMHGSLVDYLAWLEGTDDKTAIKRVFDLAQGQGLVLDEARKAQIAQDQAARHQEETERRKRYEANAIALWSRAAPVVPSSPVAAYLTHRGLDLDQLGDALRAFRTAHLGYRGGRVKYPAMLACVGGPGVSGEPDPAKHKIVAVHRTYLAPGGKDKLFGKNSANPSKLGLGSWWQGATRLTPAKAQLYITEGLETGLSVLQALRATGKDPAVWCALSRGNMAAVLLPAQVREVVLVADNDADTDKKKANNDADLSKAWRAHRDAGRSVRIVWPADGMDANDMLVGG